jgi:diguanylate cyclase (GGDEF)-like protein
VRAAARVARLQREGLHDLLRTMRMAEQVTGIGVWQYDPATGTQRWSDGLKRLFGIEDDEPFVPGDAETLLLANAVDLTGQIRAHTELREPYTLTFDLGSFDGGERSIAVHACNLRDATGALLRVVAVMRDVTEQSTRERERERDGAQATAPTEADTAADQAHMLGEIDPLTGIANRRRVMHELDRMVMRARISQMPLGLVLFDIDHFKKLNDAHGRPEGDRVLQQVAHIAAETAREIDLVGRVGGEEFAWIMPGANESMARIMSEKLRQAIARGSAVGQIPPVTISLGFATALSDDTALSLFARSDAALHEAKQAGRNRVRMAA